MACVYVSYKKEIIKKPKAAAAAAAAGARRTRVRG